MKLTRRRRIRILVKPTRLTEAHTLNELRDPQTAAHAEMVRLIGGFALLASTRGKDAIRPESENTSP
jgi:hypothetical protein